MLRTATPRSIAAACLAVLVLAVLPAARPATAAAGDDRPLVLFDVAPGSYYAPAVDWLRHRGLTTGVGGNAVFRPAATLTRAELATFLWRWQGEPPAPPSGFSDVPAGAWFSAAVGWLRDRGLTTGVGGTNRFEPNGTVSRAELATFLWRLRGEPGAPPSGFGDVPPDAWFGPAVGWLRDRGFTTGVGGSNTFAPYAAVARAEMATLLWRVAGRPGVPSPDIPPFRFDARQIGSTLADRMTPSSWRPGCPVALSHLRYLRIRHWTYSGRTHVGELVVHEDVVAEMRLVFSRLYRDRFPIARMQLVDDYGGDDNRSMAANNTSAFNCRRTTGGTSWSAHAYGTALDVNPVQNPYVRGSTVLPEAARSYLDRSRWQLGMIREGDAFVRAVDAIGWQWGGRWQSLKDYQHINR